MFGQGLAKDNPWPVYGRPTLHKIGPEECACIGPTPVVPTPYQLDIGGPSPVPLAV